MPRGSKRRASPAATRTAPAACCRPPSPPSWRGAWSRPTRASRPSASSSAPSPPGVELGAGVGPVNPGWGRLRARAAGRLRLRTGGFCDLAGLEAGGAHVDPLRRAVHDRADPLDVRVPAPLGAAVRVADAHAEDGFLPHTSHTDAMTRTSPRSDEPAGGTAETASSDRGTHPPPMADARAASAPTDLRARRLRLTATRCAPTRRAQPAQRLPGARRRHRHEHGAHARVGGAPSSAAPTPTWPTSARRSATAR